MAGKSEDGWSGLGGDGHVVCGGGLVAVSWAPDHHVWQSAEMCKCLNRLMSWAVLTKTDRVVSSDPDDPLVRERRQTDSTGGVRDEVEESTTSWDVETISCNTVHGSAHGVLTDTISQISAVPVTELRVWWLEVHGLLPSGVVRASKICGTGQKLWNGGVDLLEDGLGQLSRCDGLIRWSICGQRLLPALWELALQAACEIRVLLWEFALVRLEELVPLLLGCCTI